MAKGSLRRPGWWAARSLREKRLLLVAAAMVALFVIWLVAIRPLVDARGEATQRLDKAVTELAKARAKAATVRQTAEAAPQVPRPLQPFITQSAEEQGFTNLNVTASAENRVAISSPQLRAPAFFGWIAQLEARGLTIETLSARANSDMTIAVDAVLRAGGD